MSVGIKILENGDPAFNEPVHEFYVDQAPLVVTYDIDLVNTASYDQANGDVTSISETINAEGLVSPQGALGKRIYIKNIVVTSGVMKCVFGN